MRGLLIKDLLTLKQQGLIMLLLMVFYVVISYYSRNVSMLCAIINIFAALLPCTALSYDERCKWEQYGLCMPISRKHIVISKYLLGMILLGLALIFSIVVAYLFGDSLQDSFFMGTIMLTGGVFFFSATTPIFFKVGVEKGRIAMMVVLFVPVILTIAFGNKINSSELLSTAMSVLENYTLIIPWVLLAANVIMLFLSMLISMKIYARKEI